MGYNFARAGIRRISALGTAAALVFGATLGAIPTAAADSPELNSVGSAAAGAVSTGSGPAPAGISDDGLDEAILRDLGMTPEQFAAAGEQGKRAADVAASVRDLPGFVGISLKDGKIVVEGSGPELEAKVAELNQSGPDEIVVVPAGTESPAPGSPTGSPEATPAPTPSAPGSPAPGSAAPAPTADPGPAPAPSATETQAPSAPEATPSTAPAPTASPAPSSAAPAAPTGPAPESPGTGNTDPDRPALIAASTDQLYQAYIREVGTDGLQAVVYGDGHFTIRTGGTNSAESSPAFSFPQQPVASQQPKVSPSEFVAKYANVRLEEGDPIAAEEDLFGGQGYYVDRTWVCSAGYSAFSPAGAPLVLTAGHCADDGAARLAEVAIPAGEPAGGSTAPVGVTGILGTFGFSQFGGPNNSWITGNEANPGNVGTDIAVIEGIRSGLDPQPSATRWDNTADLGATAVKIVGRTLPFQGQSVCRSGRTTGWSCGTVDEVGIYVLGGPTGQKDDLRAIRGFLSYSVQSSGGDSGGPWISGNFAVGTHTAGDGVGADRNFAIATTLEDAMTRLPGVQLEVFLNKPVLTNPADGGEVAGGFPIMGRVEAAPATAVPANSKVRISVPGQDPLEVPVGADGSWQFTAPATPGKFAFTAETVNGFSRSGAVAFEVDVEPGVLPVPEISSPAQDAVLTSLEQIEGTGTPGATVELSGGITGSAIVPLTGRWTIPVEGDMPFGTVTVTAVQTARGMQDSPPAARSFTLVPPAPAVTSMHDGQHFPWNAVPAEVTGTGLDGAQVTVTLDGTKVGESVVEPNGEADGEAVDKEASAAPAAVGPEDGGTWRVGLPSGLAPGNHTIAVTQSVDGAASSATALTFVVDPEPEIVQILPAEAPRTSDLASTGRTDGQLPFTGASGVWLFAGVGGGGLVLGGLILLAVRRMRRTRVRRD